MTQQHDLPMLDMRNPQLSSIKSASIPCPNSTVFGAVWRLLHEDGGLISVEALPVAAICEQTKKRQTIFITIFSSDICQSNNGPWFEGLASQHHCNTSLTRTLGNAKITRHFSKVAASLTVELTSNFLRKLRGHDRRLLAIVHPTI